MRAGEKGSTNDGKKKTKNIKSAASVYTYG